MPVILALLLFLIDTGADGQAAEEHTDVHPCHGDTGHVIARAARPEFDIA